MTSRTPISPPMPARSAASLCAACEYDLVPGQIHLFETSKDGKPGLRMWLCDRCWTSIWKRDSTDPGQWTSNEEFYGDSYRQRLQDGEIQASEAYPRKPGRV